MHVVERRRNLDVVPARRDHQQRLPKAAVVLFIHFAAGPRPALNEDKVYDSAVHRLARRIEQLDPLRLGRLCVVHPVASDPA